MTSSKTRAAAAALLATALCPLLLAEETRVWRQQRYDQLRKGVADGVSLSSNGRVRLALALQELHDAPASYVWDLAVGPDGSVYAAVGPEARVVRVKPGGETEVVFETDAVEAHAVAIAADGAVLVATNPSGKLYRISAGSEPEVFYDPGAAAIWDLAVSPNGDVFIATGDRGEIHRVTPSGEGSLFFKTGETHVRTLAFDAEGRLLAGTDPGGLVFRIEGGRGFVLYESPKAELTALAVGADGAVYAAGAGTKTSGGGGQTEPQSAAGQASGGGQGTPAQPPPPSPLRGGSEIVRIGRDDAPQVWWSSAEEIVYSLGFDAEGRLLIGTGGQGRLFRVEDERTYRLERTLSSDQVTAIASGPGGRMFLATSNVGKIFSLGPETEARGELLSETHDAGGLARWGRLEYAGSGSGVALYARTGNVKRPGSTWSDWSAAVTDPAGARPGVPGARYAQWKLELSSPESEVSAVRLLYRPANLAPTVTLLELTPPGFRFPPRGRTVSPVRTVTLPPLGAEPPRRAATGSPQAMTEAPGWMGLRWRAEDPNDDDLEATVEIRSEEGGPWIDLQAEPDADLHSFDASGFADGWYRLRVTVSDAGANPLGEGLSGSLESDPFLIDNTAPGIRDLSAIAESGGVRLAFRAEDSASRIAEAAVSVDGGDWLEIAPMDGLFDSRELEFSVTLESGGMIAVRVRDQRGNQKVQRISP